MKNTSLKRFLFVTAFILIAIISIAGYLYFAKQKPALAAGTFWYIDNTAVGTNNGTSWINAWQSFATINWTSVQPGDTIYISGGTTSKTYNEQLTIGTSGTVGSPIIIKIGQDAGHNGLVIIDGNSTINNCFNIYGKQYITVSGELNGGINLLCKNTYSHGIAAVNPTGIKINYIEINNVGAFNNTHGVAFANIVGVGNELSYSSIHGAYQDGISVGTGPVNTYGIVAIHHNNIYDISDDGIQGGSGLDIYNNNIGGLHIPPKGPGHPDSVQAMGGYVRIYNNKFTEVGGQNVFIDPIYASGQIVENIYVYNNVFEHGTNSNAIVIGGDTPNPPNGLNNVYVLNNTIVDSDAIGINVGPGKIGASGTLTNTFILNNIIHNAYKTNASAGSAIGMNVGVYSPTDVVIDYNTIHEGGSGSSKIAYKGVLYTHDNFVAAGLGQSHGHHTIPNFIAYTQGTVGNDLHLSSSDTSSRDLGVDLMSYFITDKDGTPRPQGSAWDIGAYEYIQTPPPLKGDFNSDKKVNDLDFTDFKNAFKSIFNSLFDLNSDSIIDVKDLGVLMGGWLE